MVGPVRLKAVMAVPKEPPSAPLPGGTREHTQPWRFQWATQAQRLREPFPMGLEIALRVRIRTSTALGVTHAAHRALQLEGSMLQGRPPTIPEAQICRSNLNNTVPLILQL